MAYYLVIGLFFAGLLHVFFSAELVTKHIGKNSISSVIKASLLGVPLPLCSCGVIPTAVFLRKSGASTGAVASFLISTPQTGIDSIIATYGMLGLPLAIYRPIAAFLSGIFGGTLISKTVKNELTENLGTANISCSSKDSSCGCSHNHSHNNTLNEAKNKPTTIRGKIKRLFSYAFIEMLDDIAIHLVIGIIIAALINQLIPDTFFVKYGLTSGLPAMLLMVAIGLPMYICSTSSIPIAITLMMKGFSPGAAFVFLFAGPVTNAASISVLIKTLGKKVTALYIFSVTVMAIVFGLLFDFITGGSYALPSTVAHISHGSTSEILKLIIAAIFLLLLIRSIGNRIYQKYFKKETATIMNEHRDLTIQVSGMSCNHCANSIIKMVSQLEGVEDVDVNLSTKSVRIRGNDFDQDDIKHTIKELGYFPA